MSGLNAVYYDEEELLPFNVFVAELELLVGSARDRARPDQVLLLELLQKLVGSIGATARSVLKASQKRCEEALLSVLCKGACAPVSGRLRCLHDAYKCFCMI
jgi:hypothetical protein